MVHCKTSTGLNSLPQNLLAGHAEPIIAGRGVEIVQISVMLELLHVKIADPIRKGGIVSSVSAFRLALFRLPTAVV
jgi:hypothetical protein